MRLSGFRKQVILYVVCLCILILGAISGAVCIEKTKSDKDFWVQKRIEFSKELPSIQAGHYENQSYKFFISKKNKNEQSVTVTEINNLNSVKVGSVVPTEILFQNETVGYFKEFDGNKTGCMTFLIENDEEAFLTFLFDLREYENRQTLLLVKASVLPVAVSIILVGIILIINLCIMRRKLFKPIKRISEISNNVCCGDFENNYLEINQLANEADEISTLVYSFEQMRDELKAKLEENEKLSKSEKELISCISHDLQTPLATIKAYGEGIRDNIASTDEEKAKYIEVIINKTNTMIDMIKDLLEFSNAQLNKLPMEFKEIMSLDFFEPLLIELKGYAKQKKVDLTYDIDQTNVMLRIDPKRMTQVLYNLVENAMKYMDKEEKHIKIKVLRKNQTLHVEVSDNGMGISPEELLFVFDKFYRAEKSRSGSIPGTGLGLSICKYIMKEHGGDIWCDSKQKEGSTFCLLLPLE